MQVISFVGRSNAGKTTLIEHLIAELRGKGYKVATVKHARDNIEMDMDKEGKDSWRFAQAGSDVVVVGSQYKLVSIKRMDHEPELEEILPLILGTDLALVEGFKRWKIPKIEVHPKGEDLLYPPEELSAIISDEPLKVSAPCFLPSDTKAIADFILQSLMSPDCETHLLVNDKPIPLNHFT
jgi:molybdopterin-guanine dinucleotide biosynthesis protein MobB